MRKFAGVLLVFSGLLFLGCEKDNMPLVNNSDQLIGYWSNPVYQDTVWRYERVNGFQENQYTLAFKIEQEFIERKNAGWCGTPPVTYENFQGTWTRTDDEIKISVGYWGGTAAYRWRIISIDNKYLTIYRFKEEYNWENKN